MKILWVKSDFLHPTTRGGQIRTLEMLKRLAARHEVHYVGFDDPQKPADIARSREYCARAYPIPHSAPPRRSAAFAAQMAAGLFSDEPVSIRRYRSPEMRRVIADLAARERFDSIVCDFLTPAVNLPALGDAVLFQHNVESVIWERHAATESNPVARTYLRGQAVKMRAFEQDVCRKVRHVVAVSEIDARLFEQMYGVRPVSWVPTGVDVDFFRPPAPAEPAADLVFVGSMDWLPNIDGINFFVTDVLPIIRRARPACSLAIVGRQPPASLIDLARNDPHITVTGTVPDVRPYLWGSAVSIVPLRIGGGTRLKIFEAMAAGIPVVSTTIGAEGLSVSAPEHIRLADAADQFARECLALLEHREMAARMAAAALEHVTAHYSWAHVTGVFEDILRSAATVAA